LGEVLTTPLRKRRMLRITHVEMLPLETKHSGGKLLPHSDLRGGGVFLEEVSRSLLSFSAVTNSLKVIQETEWLTADKRMPIARKISIAVTHEKVKNGE
jgi:hypothetical protein